MKLAEIEGMPAETFRSYRSRFGLLDHVKTVRGLPAQFSFADALTARLAFTMMRLGFDKKDICDYVGHSPVALKPFLEGRPVEICLRDGHLSHSRILNDDPFLSIPMERDGWAVAEAFLADIRGRKGPEAAEGARSHLEQNISRIRDGYLRQPVGRGG
ncbi:hypothetical protein [Haematobacter sp.]|uniref:hypothetical protein n=1 Tax=Haematobacter sp. TaxID=2953762 RepID=UPI0028AEFDB4|nr:hypothetical protein [Haematobacter sp.]